MLRGNPICGDLAARTRFGSAPASHKPCGLLGPIRRACGRTLMTERCGSMGYWREALFIASATHGKIPCAGKGW
jgi:hypothetical protein